MVGRKATVTLGRGRETTLIAEKDESHCDSAEGRKLLCSRRGKNTMAMVVREKELMGRLLTKGAIGE